MWRALKPGKKNLRLWQALVLVIFFAIWHGATRDPKVAFFFGDPSQVLVRIWQWFTVGGGSLEVGFGDATWFTLHFPAEIYSHLLITLTETLLAFGIGTTLGLGVGLWLALSPLTSAILDPYIKAANSMPRVILAPIFAMWFGLGIWSKVALGVTLVFFVVFFNVFQGVREVSPAVLSNSRMLGANARHLMRHVYLPSATSWVFSSLHNAIGIAFVGSVVGEYLGSEKGVGYLILLAEGVFDIDSVIAGILVLTVFALALDTAVSMIEDHLLRWRPVAGQTVSAGA